MWVDKPTKLCYNPVSDRVAIACEARNLKGFLREPLYHFIRRSVSLDDKKFMTYDEQIRFLQNEKLLIIDNPTKALSLLKQHSYFALINGYKHPFKNKNGTYKARTTLEDIYALYCFDNKIRYILMRNIMDVEIHIKSLLSYAFADKFGELETAYLAATNYNYSNVIYQSDINELIRILTDVRNNCNTYTYMKHQKECHGNIPPWVIMKAITLGNVSKMYSCQKPEIQTVVSKEFPGVTEGNLEAFLDLLTRFRNVCAHNERLFNYRYYKRSINDMQIHKAMNIPKKNNRYTKGKSDLFAVLIALKYLQAADKFSALIQELNEAINHLLKSTAQIKREQLYKYMGFPTDWESIEQITVK